jgi:hypothetical protein
MRHFGLNVNPCKEVRGSKAYWTKTKLLIEVCTPIILKAEDMPSDCASGVEDIYYGFTYKGKWYPENKEDEYCGNYNITFKNGKWWYMYTRPIHFKEECTHILEYWTKDRVCNTGPIFNQTYYVDSTPPSSSKEVGSPKYENWVNWSTNITIKAKDGCGGLDYIHYEIWWDSDNDGSVDKKLEEKNVHGNVTFRLDKKECLHEIRWYAVDIMGHEESVHSQHHKVDNTPPESICLYTVRGNSAHIYLSAKDQGKCQVGLKGIWYQLGKRNGYWSEWKLSSSPLILTLDIKDWKYLRYYAVDYLDNKEEVKEIQFYGGPIIPLP